MRFGAGDTALEGLKLLTRAQVSDQRGQFSRLYCQEQLNELGWSNGIAQSNLSITHEVGTVRGLHFQNQPFAEAKLVTCIRGAVFDVAVDLRAGSKSFGQWYGVELSASNMQSLLIPAGFAHGFQALQEHATMVYFHSAPYESDAESGVRWDDPDLAIDWPLEAKNLTERDQSLPALAAIGTGVEI